MTVIDLPISSYAIDENNTGMKLSLCDSLQFKTISPAFRANVETRIHTVN